MLRRWRGRWVLGGLGALLIGSLALLLTPGPHTRFLMLVLAVLPVAIGLLPGLARTLGQVIADCVRRVPAAGFWAGASALAGAGLLVLLSYLPASHLAWPGGAGLLVAVFVLGAIGCFSTLAPLWRRALPPEDSAAPAWDYVDASALHDGRVVTLARYGLLRERVLAAGATTPRAERFAEQLRAVRAEGLSDAPLDFDPLAAPERARLRIVTADAAAASEARAAGLAILDVPDLARRLRPELRRGSTLSVRLQRRGTQARQAVGFLDDGTPVVVAQAEALVGREVPVVVARYVERPTGRVVFADLAEGYRPGQPRRDAGRRR